LHSRSESDLENDVDVDRYYEVARSSYNTATTSSSTPHLLLDNTLSRPLQQQQQQLQQQQQQPYSAYYQSFGRTLKMERKNNNKNKISKWIKTKLTRSESSGGRQTAPRRPVERPYADFSYSGANTLLRRPSGWFIPSFDKININWKNIFHFIF
jgi:hypothetical protein